MALMEREGNNTDDAMHIVGAMVNRARKAGVDLGEHVGEKIYQPSFEPSQEARIDRLLKSPDFATLSQFADDRWNGRVPDNVSGATHYLAPERTMLALEAREPAKYKNWGPRGANWTGYDPQTGSYRGVVLRDRSHAFLAPDGAYSAPGPDGSTPAPFQVADNPVPPILQSGYGRNANTTQPSPVGGAGAAPFAVASNGGGSSSTPAAGANQGSQAPFAMASADQPKKSIAQLFGENLAAVMTPNANNAKPQDTSLLQNAVDQEAERRKQLVLSPFQLARMA